MKKLIILVSILVLIASGMAFGQLTYQGKLYYGALSNFKDDPGFGWDIRSILQAKIDDFNTMEFRIRLRNYNYASGFNGTSTTAPSWNTMWLLSSDAPFVDRAFITTNVTGALGLKDAGVDVTLISGFINNLPGADLTAGISPFEISDLDQMDLGTGGKQAAFDLDVLIAKMFHARFTVAPGDWKTTSQETYVFTGGRSGGWKADFYGTVPVGPGTLTPEFEFAAPGGVKPGNGTIVFAAKYSQAAGDIAFNLVPQFRYLLNKDYAGANYNIAMGAGGTAGAFTYTNINSNCFTPVYNQDGDPISYYYAIAASASYQKLAVVKLGWLGYKGSMANRMEAELIVTPTPIFGIDIGTVLNIDKDEYPGAGSAYYGVAAGETAMLQVIDLGAFIMAGKTKIQVGYIYTGKKAFGDPIGQDLSTIGRGNSVTKQGGMYLSTLVNF